jgi:lipopolysaccharide cholinephosphotransferase
LQRIELAILEEFVKACENLKLTYFVLGGTLLGAMRHGGFIPWDDDIDVGMPRDDYERFMKCGQRELSEHYFLQNYFTDPEYPGNHAKIRDNRTTLVETCVKHCNMNHGVYIDIFPLDGVPENRLKRRIDKLRLRILHFQLGRYYFRKAIKGHVVNAFSYTTAWWMPLRKIQRKIDSIRMSNRYSDSRFVANYSGRYANREIVPREYFGGGTRLKFETLDVLAPEKVDLYLKNIYGNYMQLPPEEKRTPEHLLERFDLDAPFTQFVKKAS